MQVFFSNNAAKQFGRLPQSEQQKIRKKLIQLDTDPLAGIKLAGELADCRSLRFWPYHIIYFINRDRSQVEVSEILHRHGASK